MVNAIRLHCKSTAFTAYLCLFMPDNRFVIFYNRHWQHVMKKSKTYINFSQL